MAFLPLLSAAEAKMIGQKFIREIVLRWKPLVIVLINVPIALSNLYGQLFLVLVQTETLQWRLAVFACASVAKAGLTLLEQVCMEACKAETRQWTIRNVYRPIALHPLTWFIHPRNNPTEHLRPRHSEYFLCEVLEWILCVAKQTLCMLVLFFWLFSRMPVVNIGQLVLIQSLAMLLKQLARRLTAQLQAHSRQIQPLSTQCATQRKSFWEAITTWKILRGSDAILHQLLHDDHAVSQRILHAMLDPGARGTSAHTAIYIFERACQFWVLSTLYMDDADVVSRFGAIYLTYLVVFFWTDCSEQLWIRQAPMVMTMRRIMSQCDMDVEGPVEQSATIPADSSDPNVRANQVAQHLSSMVDPIVRANEVAQLVRQQLMLLVKDPKHMSRIVLEYLNPGWDSWPSPFAVDCKDVTFATLSMDPTTLNNWSSLQILPSPASLVRNLNWSLSPSSITLVRHTRDRDLDSLSSILSGWFAPHQGTVTFQNAETRLVSFPTEKSQGICSQELGKWTTRVDVTFPSIMPNVELSELLTWPDHVEHHRTPESRAALYAVLDSWMQSSTFPAFGRPWQTTFNSTIPSALLSQVALFRALIRPSAFIVINRLETLPLFLQGWLVGWIASMRQQRDQQRSQTPTVLILHTWPESPSGHEMDSVVDSVVTFQDSGLVARRRIRG